MKVAFVGLGVMGFPMAGHLARAGHDVCVYNRTAARAEKWLETYPGSRADTPQAAAQSAEIVFTCVGNDADLREVVIGEQGSLPVWLPVPSWLTIQQRLLMWPVSLMPLPLNGVSVFGCAGFRWSGGR